MNVLDWAESLGEIAVDTDECEELERTRKSENHHRILSNRDIRASHNGSNGMN